MALSGSLEEGRGDARGKWFSTTRVFTPKVQYRSNSVVVIITHNEFCHTISILVVLCCLPVEMQNSIQHFPLDSKYASSEFHSKKVIKLPEQYNIAISERLSLQLTTWFQVSTPHRTFGQDSWTWQNDAMVFTAVWIKLKTDFDSKFEQQWRHNHRSFRTVPKCY